MYNSGMAADFVSLSEARASLPRLLDQVAAGAEVTITRHGRPVAVLVSPDALRVRRAGPALATAAAIGELVAGAAERPLAAEGSLTPARAKKLMVEVDSGRSGR